MTFIKNFIILFLFIWIAAIIISFKYSILLGFLAIIFPVLIMAALAN